MKRFWSHAAVVQRDGVFAIELDGRPMRLPGGPHLRLHQRGLADAIAAEWQAAGEAFGADDVPLTRLAGTAQERIVPDRVPTALALAAYGETDLLCYRAERPEALVARQAALWQPWLNWAADTYCARLVVTSGLMPVAQPDDAIEALRDSVLARDGFVLAGLGVLVPILGSLVLGLAVADGQLAADAAFQVSILDDLFEQALWGVDADAEKRLALAARDVADVARFMALAVAD
jgi:chaperone required for assembly of F1-ATPase